MRKDFLKGIVLGVVCTLTLSFSVSAIAANISKKIDVAYKNIKVYVYGEEKKPSQEPFVYEGSTYVPLRFISEALGETVDWDGNTNSIYIGGKPKAADASNIYSHISAYFPVPQTDVGVIPYDNFEIIEEDPSQDLFRGYAYYYYTPTLGSEALEMGYDPLLYLAQAYIGQLEGAGFEKVGDEGLMGIWTKAPSYGVKFYYDEINRVTIIYMYFY